MLKNSFISKIRLISKFMPSQPGKQITAVHTLPNVSRSEGNQTLKFHQLIEYGMTNVFLEKLFKNVIEKLFSDPFLENQN